MKLIPDEIKEEIGRHVMKVKDQMMSMGIDGLLVGYNSNVYYLTGRFFRGYVYLSVSFDPIWFVIKPDSFEKEGNVVSIRKPEEIPGILNERNMPFPQNFGLELDSLSYSEITRLSRLFPDARLQNGSEALRRARMAKTDWEIDLMKIDGHKQATVYGQVNECYRKGMTDLELQIEIERRLRLAGALGFTRTAGNLMEINMGSLIAGENADTPSPYDFTMGGEGTDPSLPGGANGKPIHEGETVMVDMSGAFNAYQTDMTRVWKLGEISQLAKKAHDCSIEILRALEMFVKPGVKISDVYELAMGIVEAEGLEKYFMGHASQVSFIGHGVGIELNEPPVIMKKSRDTAEKNMTLAIEPKFVIPGVGAVGVENTYRITDNGLENLTVFPEGIRDL